MNHCPICNKIFENNYNALCYHWRLNHNETIENLYLKYHNLSSPPTCACGCGNLTKFLGIIKGYTTYNRGHQPAPGFTKEALEKSHETYRQNLASGKTVRKKKQKIIDSSKEFKCPYCPISYDELISLSLHARGKHKKKARSLHIDLYCNGIEPTCKCGCGELTKYLGIYKGFTEYKIGHISRVENSYTKPEIVAKSQATRKQQWENIRNGNGDNGVWKGGITDLRRVVYSNTKLKNEWRKPILKKYKYKCVKCGSKKGIEVHHDKERFSTILNQYANFYGWKERLTARTIPNEVEITQLKDKISNAVADYHVNNNVSGIVLCEECHAKEHKK